MGAIRWRAGRTAIRWRAGRPSHTIAFSAVPDFTRYGAVVKAGEDGYRKLARTRVLSAYWHEPTILDQPFPPLENSVLIVNRTHLFQRFNCWVRLAVLAFVGEVSEVYFEGESRHLQQLSLQQKTIQFFEWCLLGISHESPPELGQ
jgi:hypothetical protein